MGVYHPYLTVLLVLAIIGLAFYILRGGLGGNGRDRLNAWGLRANGKDKGYFYLGGDEKGLGLLGGGGGMPNGKAD